jgi:formyltetrahydrofolate synthetase
MWRFDQGRIEYFQFNELRKIAKLAVANDLKSATRQALADATGLPFYPASDAYSHIVPVREVRLAAGAGFVVAICGEIMTMPGLPRVPAAEGIGIDAQGAIKGLF